MQHLALPPALLHRAVAAAMGASVLLATACGGTPVAPHGAPAVVAPVPIVERLRSAANGVDQALVAAQSGDLVASKRHYLDYDDAWEEMEGGVKKESMEIYKAIEGSMDDVRDALVKTPSPTREATVPALQRLRRTIDDQAARLRG